MSRVSDEELARAALAQERDAAVQRLNAVVQQARQMEHAFQVRQQQMVTWVIAMILKTGATEVTFREADLEATLDYVLRRTNDPEKKTVTWTLEGRATHELKQAQLADIAKGMADLADGEQQPD